MSVLPTVSYKVNDWLAVGAGLNAMFGFLDSQMAVNNGPGGPLWNGGDGQLKIKDANWGFGANAGVLVKFSEQTRVGVSYLSRVHLDFSVTPSWSNLRPGLATALDRAGLLNGKLNLGSTVPQQVMAGVYHDLNRQWSLMLDAGWQNWAVFGQPTIGVTSENTTSLTLDNNYQNTWHLAGGAEFRLNPDWPLTGGVSYDSSPMTDDNRTVTLPLGSTWRFGLGAMWQVSKQVNLGAAYQFLWNGDLGVDQNRGPLAGRVAGTYEGSYLMFVALNLNWKF
jgi:long-chain fatty acid transport protein